MDHSTMAFLAPVASASLASRAILNFSQTRGTAIMKVGRAAIRVSFSRAMSSQNHTG